MQLSIVKSAPRTASKLLVSTALAEMLEDEKLDFQEVVDEDYEEYGMMQMIEDMEAYDDFESGRSYYADDEPEDYDYYYGPYDYEHDPYEYDFGCNYPEPPRLDLKEDAGQSLGDILQNCLARRA
jgi:hypothetical protein